MKNKKDIESRKDNKKFVTIAPKRRLLVGIVKNTNKKETTQENVGDAQTKKLMNYINVLEKRIKRLEIRNQKKQRPTGFLRPPRPIKVSSITTGKVYFLQRLS